MRIKDTPWRQLPSAELFSAAQPSPHSSVAWPPPRFDQRDRGSTEKIVENRGAFFFVENEPLFVHVYHAIHHNLSTNPPQKFTTFPKTPLKNSSKTRKSGRSHPPGFFCKNEATEARKSPARLLHRALPYVARAGFFRRRRRPVPRHGQRGPYAPAGQRNFTAFSLWDTLRAAHPAYTLIEPDRVPQFVNTLIRMAEQSPERMPVWPLMGAETGTMTGYHSAAVISEACNKGFTGVDWEKTYRLMMKRAMVDDYRGLPYYRKRHYIPADKEEESVSKTFEYCYHDWSIAHVARKLGKTDDAAMLAKRSTNYRNYFDASVGFMRPKLEDGSWASPFDPIDMGHSKKWRDYTESNAWQTTFGVQHDVEGLIQLFGGREQFVAKLDDLFSAPSTLPADAPPDIAGLVGQYAHGNEPSHHIAYLYVYAGVPHKTQARVRSLLETMYSPEPDGMQGNEDVGQMSAWYILSALGFYPVDPVSGIYIVGSPLFEHATVELGGGKKLEIEVRRKDPAHQYVQAFSLNGKPQQRTWFHHGDIARGGKLVLEMGSEPNPSLGSDVTAASPSLTL